MDLRSGFWQTAMDPRDMQTWTRLRAVSFQSAELWSGKHPEFVPEDNGFGPRWTYLEYLSCLC